MVLSNVESEIFCKLCLRSTKLCGALQRSHIIPRFIWMTVKDKGRYVSYSTVRGSAELGQSDWREEMLCFDCEQLISIKYESYLKEILYKNQKEKLLVKSEGCFVMGGIESNRLSVALLSILWRCLVTGVVEFDHIKLPDSFCDFIRVAVFTEGSAAAWQDVVRVRVVKIRDLSQGVRASFLWSGLLRRNDSKSAIEIVLVLGSYCVFF